MATQYKSCTQQINQEVEVQEARQKSGTGAQPDQQSGCILRQIERCVRPSQRGANSIVRLGRDCNEI